MRSRLAPVSIFTGGMPVTGGIMEKAFVRKPIGNFFILKDLQTRLILKILATVLLSTVVTLVSLLLVYFIQFKSVLFYQLNLDQELLKENIFDILLPSLLISAVVNVAVGLLVGMYASRKYAVPIYKLEQWARLLRKGSMTARLVFREKEELQELSTQCNLLAEEIREKFSEIKQHVQNAMDSDSSSTDIKAIEEIVSQLELDQDSIHVNTAFFTLPPESLQKKSS